MDQSSTCPTFQFVFYTTSINGNTPFNSHFQNKKNSLWNPHFLLELKVHFLFFLLRILFYCIIFFDIGGHSIQPHSTIHFFPWNFAFKSFCSILQQFESWRVATAEQCTSPNFSSPYFTITTLSLIAPSLLTTISILSMMRSTIIAFIFILTSLHVILSPLAELLYILPSRLSTVFTVSILLHLLVSLWLNKLSLRSVSTKVTDITPPTDIYIIGRYQYCATVLLKG